MTRSLQIVVSCLMAVHSVFARPGYAGYPYGAVPLHHGHHAALPVHDTPEVAAAKAAHFAAYGAAAAAAGAAPDYGHGAYGGHNGGHYDDGQYHPGHYDDGQDHYGHYAGSYAGHNDDGQYHPGLYDDGQDHYGGHYGHYDDGQYHGGHYGGVYGGHYAAHVPAVPVDTPEVAAAKAAHFAAHAHVAGHHYG